MKEKITLFCFPYSGASASLYLGWTPKISENIKLQPVEYPGRGSRFGEKLCQDMDQLIDAIMPVIMNTGTESCAFFGHSLGGIVAYETALRLREEKMELPKHIFLSGCTAPHVKYGEKKLHLLSNDDFLKELTELGGMSQEILNNREILDLYLPVIRADYRIYELYQPKKQEPLPVDFSVLSGSVDVLAGGANMLGWKVYTSAGFQVNQMEGNHFFIHEQLSSVIDVVEKTVIGWGNYNENTKERC